MVNIPYLFHLSFSLETFSFFICLINIIKRILETFANEQARSRLVILAYTSDIKSILHSALMRRLATAMRGNYIKSIPTTTYHRKAVPSPIVVAW